jgi:hypothetical protein
MSARPRLDPFSTSTPQPVRSTVAWLLTGWLVVQVAAILLAAARTGSPEDTVRFWLTGLLTVVLGFYVFRAWRWVHVGRVKLIVDTEDP